MEIDAIDAAILAHRAWVGGFKTSCNGTNTEVFDLAKARDASACALGRWLSLPATRQQLGEAAYLEINRLHDHFHETAGTIASLLNQRQSLDGTRTLIARFDELSKELVTLLRLSKRKP